jgi:hypothetical protein
MDTATEQDVLLDSQIVAWLEDWPILRLRRIVNSYYTGRQGGKSWSFRQAALAMMQEEREHAKTVHAPLQPETY